VLDQLFSKQEKRVAIAKGGTACSALNLRDLASAYNQLGQAERRSPTWLLLPNEVDKQHLVTDGNYFRWNAAEYRPATSAWTRELKLSVGTAAAKKAREDGCPSALKMLMWQQPTERDWDAALQWLCKNRHVQVAALFLVARRAAQRGHDVKRLCLGDVMWRQAGSEAKGTAIPFLALTPDGPKMMQVFRWWLRNHAQ